MTKVDLSQEEKKDLIGKVTELCERNVLKQIHYAAILGVCKAACEQRMKEIEQVIGKPSDIVQ